MPEAHGQHEHAIEPWIDRARSAFKEHGLRSTRQRELVYAALASTDAHPTVEDLLARVRTEDPGISQATVYNTLDTLVGSGLARRLPAGTAGGACRYDADLHPHVHLTLPDGRVVDAPDQVTDAILAALAGDPMRELGVTGDHITGVRIDLTGHAD